MAKSKKQWVVFGVGLLLVLGLLVGVKASQILTMVRAAESMAPPPEAVSSARAELTEWESSRAAIASIVAVQGVTMAAELPGTVREIAFESGTSVKRGALLVKLDTSAEEAQLAAATAEATLARVNLERTRKLRAGGANAPADLDAAEARAKQAQATVRNLQATIAKKSIRAPFDGRIGIRQVELGQVVAPGSPIASLQSVSPIRADFWLPQQALADLETGQRARSADGHLPGRDVGGGDHDRQPGGGPGDAERAGARHVPERGRAPSSGDVRERGRPLGRASDPCSPSLPRRSCSRPTATRSSPSRRRRTPAERRPRSCARSSSAPESDRGDLVAVVAGLNPGEPVVSSGAFKLRNGAPVVVNDSLAPEARLSPSPKDE